MSGLALLPAILALGGGEHNAPRVPVADYVTAFASALIASAILLNAIGQVRAGKLSWRWGRKGKGPEMSAFSAIVSAVFVSAFFFWAAFDFWSRARGKQLTVSFYPHFLVAGGGAIVIALIRDIWIGRKT